MANKLRVAVRGVLPKHRFARSVSLLAGGAAAGQVIVVAASPLLTRLYSPDDFGLLAVFASLLGVIGVIASLRYQLAIPLPESDVEAANVTVLSLLVVLGVALVATAVTIPWREPIAEAVNAPLLAEYIWLLPVGLLLVGVYQVFYYWAIRAKAYPAIARTKVTQSVSLVVVQVGGYALGPVALLLGRVVGQAVGTTTLGSVAFVGRREAFRKVTASGVRKVSARYYIFPMYSSLAGLLNTGGTQIPPILFSVFYGAGAAGLFMVAHRVIAMPMTLVASAIADVFMPNAVEAVREGRLKDSVASLQRYLAWIAVPPAAFLFVTAPEAFGIIFGPDWEKAGRMVRWLTPMLVLQFIVSPLSRIFVALERQRLGLILQVNLFLLRLATLALAGYLVMSLLEAVFWYGLASGLGYFAYLIAIAEVTDNSPQLFARSWLSCVPWLGVMTLFLLAPYPCSACNEAAIQAVSWIAALLVLIFYYRKFF